MEEGSVIRVATALKTDMPMPTGKNISGRLKMLSAPLLLAMALSASPIIAGAQGEHIANSTATSLNPPSATKEWEHLRLRADQDMRAGNFVEAELAYKQALAQAIKHGNDNESISESLKDFGHFYRRRGNLRQAELYFRRCLDLKEKALGPENQFLDPLLDELGQIAVQTGNLNQAKVHFERLLRIRGKAFMPADTPYTMVLSKVITLCLQLKDWRDAKTYLEREIDLKAKNQSDPSYAQDLIDLSEVHENFHQLSEAERLLKQVVQLRKGLADGQDPLFISARTSLSRLYSEQHRSAEAGALFSVRTVPTPEPTPTSASAPSPAASLVTPSSSQQYLQYASSLDLQAMKYYSSGKIDQARTLLEQEVSILTKGGIKESKGLAIALHYLAHCQTAKGNYAEAEKNSKRALALRRRLGMNDSGITNNLEELGNIYLAWKRYDDAERMWKETVVSEKRWPRSKTNLAIDMYYLGASLDAQKKFRDAGSVYKQALQIDESVPDDETIKVLLLRSLKANCLNQGKPKQALIWLKQVLRLTPKDSNVAAEVKRLEDQIVSNKDVKQ